MNYEPYLVNDPIFGQNILATMIRTFARNPVLYDYEEKQVDYKIYNCDSYGTGWEMKLSC